MRLNCPLVHVHHLLNQVAEHVVGSESLSLSLGLNGATSDKVLDDLEVDFLLLLFLSWCLIFDKLVEKHLHARLHLILSQFESVSLIAL